MKNNHWKRIVIGIVIGMLLMTVPAFAEDSSSEELLQQAEKKEAGDYDEGSVLTHDDFYVYTNDDTWAPYNNNVLDGLLSNGEMGYWAWIYPIEEEELSEYGLEEDGDDFITFRGIDILDSSKEEVIKKYGAGVEGRFDTTTDPLYQGMTNEGLPEANLLYDKACSYLLYSYQDLGQIKFYFNLQNKTVFVSYVSGIEIQPDKPCIKAVQRYLNKNGYDVGTPDGVVGQKTSAAISKFKEDHGLTVNSRVDDELMKCIYAESEESETDEETSADTEQVDNESKITQALDILRESEFESESEMETEVKEETDGISEDDIYRKAVEGYSALKSSLKSPDSLKLYDVKYNPSRDMVVYKYGATNSFGAEVTEYAVYTDEISRDYAESYYKTASMGLDCDMILRLIPEKDR